MTHQRAVDDGDPPHRLDKLAERSDVGDHRVLASGQHTCQGHRGCRPAPRPWDREDVADDPQLACGLGRAAD